MEVLYFLAQVAAIAAVVFAVEAIFREKVFKKVRVALIKRKVKRDAIKSMKLVWYTDVIFTQWRKEICDAQDNLAKVILSNGTLEELKEKLENVKRLSNKYTELSGMINHFISAEERDNMYKPFAEKMEIEIGGESSR